MSEIPDDVIGEVARHLASVWGEVLPDADDWSAALAVLSVPSVAAVFARDAKVREIVAAGRFPGGVAIHATEAMRIAALYAADGAS